MAVHVEGAGIVLARRPSEGVDGRPDRHVDEAGVLEQCLPTPTGQRAGNSTGPQVDVAHGADGNRPPVGDVGELQHAAGPQGPPDLP